jgi:hypothetical protein
MNENKIEDNPRADNDGGWKNVLSAHLKDFAAFFWPEAFQDIDWDKPYEALEQELMAIGIPEKIGKRCLDKLFKVHLKNGQEQWLLLHIEVQHSKDEDFAERMFTYFYRIYDRYCQDIASMAVLADKDLNWRPNQYHRKVWGSEITRTFEIVKLMDFKSKKKELLKNDNPFALIVLIQLAALETKADDENRLLTKLEFFRYLHQHGWSMEKAMNVYRFLDILLSLNPKFEIQYIEKAKQIDEDFNMNLTLTAERYGFQQGKQEGMQQGMQEGEGTMLMYLLERKFKAIPDLYRHKIKQVDTQTLLKWAERVLEHQALEDVFK